MQIVRIHSCRYESAIHPFPAALLVIADFSHVCFYCPVVSGEFQAASLSHQRSSAYLSYKIFVTWGVALLVKLVKLLDISLFGPYLYSSLLANFPLTVD